MGGKVDSMEIPKVGSTIQIESVKHDRKLHRRWEQNKVLYSDEHIIIGGNNKTIVQEADGKRWQTTEPAIFYFDKRYWFNVIKIFGTDASYYYCNMSSSYTYQHDKLQYIDYDIDIIVDGDWSIKVVDEKEFVTNKITYQYSDDIEKSINKHITILKKWIMSRKDPFNESFINHWYHIFLRNQK